MVQGGDWNFGKFSRPQMNQYNSTNATNYASGYGLAIHVNVVFVRPPDPEIWPPLHSVWNTPYLLIP